MNDPLHDAAHDWSIRLDESDFEDFIPCHPSRCIIANAIGRQRGVLDMRVGAGVVRVKKRHGWKRWLWPKNITRLINGVDDGRDAFAPGYVVQLLAPPPDKKLGARAGQEHGTNKRSGKNDSTASKKPSKRHIDVDPPENTA